MAHKADSKTAQAMCWYDEAQWSILKELDPDSIDESYESWRRNATRALYELAANGYNINKVGVKIDYLLDWCEERGLEPNAESRAAYAAWILQHRITQ
jgi:hypothetical protein